MKSNQLRGLYCITDPQLAANYPGTLADMTEQALLGGARIIQYRDKTASAETALTTAQTLTRLCHAHNAILLVNDDPELALAADADGVHIGQGDTKLLTARQILGPDRIIGVTCHDQIGLAQQAATDGADYVAFGRFFASQTKPEAPPASLELLNKLRQLKLPVAAIGGIQADNAAPLLASGVAMLAVIHAVFGQPDIRAAAAAFTNLFNESDKGT